MTKGDFAYWWSVPGEWVESPNERRNGWSGMMRVPDGERVLYVKRQRNHLCRTLRHPFGWPTASREWLYLHRLHQLGVAAPVPVFHGVRRTPEGVEAVLVTEELVAYRALDDQHELEPASRALLASEVGRMLGRLHGARLQHSSLYGKHIMVCWDEGSPHAALIDLEKMRPRLTRRLAADHDLEQLARRQQVLKGEDWATLLRAHAESMAAV